MNFLIRLHHLMLAAALSVLATSAASQTPLSGFDREWQAIDYSSSADDPSWQDRPEVLRSVMGARLSLGAEGFSLFDLGCADPIVLRETRTAAEVLNAMAGSTLSLVTYLDDANAPVDIVSVDCLDQGAWSFGVTDAGMAFISFFGGYLIFDAIPSDRVAYVQSRLGELGYQPGPADGIYGARTARAANQFQEQVGLPATGTITPLMISVLSRSE